MHHHTRFFIEMGSAVAGIVTALATLVMAFRRR